MSCREVAQRLTLYLDGELDGAVASAVRGHLRSCAACRREAEHHAAIRDALADLERPEPPLAVWDGVLSRLRDAEVADSRRSRAARLYDRLRPHLLPAGVAIGACTAAAGILQLRRQPPTPVPVATATHSAVAAVAPPDVPAIDLPARDAQTDLVAETARVDARYRQAASELLEIARTELRPGTGARRQFDRDVAALEGAVLSARDKARDRAWHALLIFLEHSAFGERLAAVPR